MKAFRSRLCASAVLGLASLLAPAGAQTAQIDAGPLPFADKRLPASADECTVWKRELAFARSVEAHDADAFAVFLHPGAIFNAGTPDAERGRDQIVRSWGEVVDGRTIALSRGTFILQRLEGGVPSFRVGMFQTVWVRDAKDRARRVLFDGSVTTPQPMKDRAAADRWVMDRPMSDCGA